jgi:hypothetical protein
MLTRAIRDNAIVVDGYTSTEPFFATNLRGQGIRAMKVHWKPESLKRPVFRKPVRPAGCWVKSKAEPMPYSAYAFYIDRLRRDPSFEGELTSYCFRRGTANAIDGRHHVHPFLSLLTVALGVASDAVRDQVMRHDPFTGVFNGAYINGNVRFNVQELGKQLRHTAKSF